MYPPCCRVLLLPCRTLVNTPLVVILAQLKHHFTALQLLVTKNAVSKQHSDICKQFLTEYNAFKVLQLH